MRGDPSRESIAAFHNEIASRLTSILGNTLVGAYAVGSFALGDFDPQRSDLDVIAISRDPLPVGVKQTLIHALRHETLPCPVRGLEFVVYAESVARTPTAEAAFELNLNTGPAIGFRVDLEPGAVGRHWFAIDRAMAAGSAIALHGPEARHLFAPVPRALLLPVVLESLEWHLRGRVSGDGDAVLNACRSLRYIRENVWSSKGAAGEWAVDKVVDSELVSAALATRDRSADLGRERVERFVLWVLSEAAAAIRAISGVTGRTPASRDA